VPYTTIPDVNSQARPDKQAAFDRVRAALPELILKVDQRLREMEQRAAAGQVRQIEQNAFAKEHERFRRRRLILQEGKFPMGVSDGLDPVWGAMSDRLITDATRAGLAVDDSYTPTATEPTAVAASGTLIGQFALIAEKVRRLEHVTRQQASTHDQYTAGAMLEKADTCYYVARYLDQGELPEGPDINKYVDLSNLLVPAYSAAQREGRIVASSHADDLDWARKHREWSRTHRKWR
jgi:hypothetical protein